MNNKQWGELLRIMDGGAPAREPESKPTPLPFYVIAGNYHQFQNWCRTQGLSERSGAARYVSDADQLRGVRVSQEQIVFTGNWAGRPDAELLRQMAEHACRP